MTRVLPRNRLSSRLFVRAAPYGGRRGGRRCQDPAGPRPAASTYGGNRVDGRHGSSSLRTVALLSACYRGTRPVPACRVPFFVPRGPVPGSSCRLPMEETPAGTSVTAGVTVGKRNDAEGASKSSEVRMKKWPGVVAGAIGRSAGRPLYCPGERGDVPGNSGAPSGGACPWPAAQRKFTVGGIRCNRVGTLPLAISLHLMAPGTPVPWL